jgi:methyl-branched lipid omega-hydroxylase
MSRDALAEEVDLSDPEFWLRPASARHQGFRELRQHRPLATFPEPRYMSDSPWAPAPGGEFRAVTRHADVVEVTRHPERYSSAQAISILDVPAEMADLFAGMLAKDDPAHARLRRIVSKAFSSRQIAGTMDTIDEVARQTVHRAAALGEFDFVTEVASPYPLEIICRMTGVPLSHREDIARCADTIVSVGDPEFVPPGADRFLSIFDAGEELAALLRDLAEHRRRQPADDLVTALVTTNPDGEALTDAEVSSFFILLLLAGSETTRNCLTHGIVALTEHPDQRAAWLADPGLATTAVDELIRWATPVNWIRRTATEPSVLAGEPVAVGEKLALLYCSANFDDAVFDDPFRFDLGRTPNPHLSFGAPGPHFCLGAHLARREIATLMQHLLAAVPWIEATAEPDRITSTTFVNGIKHLACRCA